jgi:hypothetical protein
MHRLVAALASVSLAACGGSSVDSPTGPTGGTSPVDPPPFAFTLTRGAAWLSSEGARLGNYWNATVSGPWAGSYVVGQFGTAPCGPGGGLPVSEWGPRGEPFFSMQCPPGGCTHVVDRLLACPCGDVTPVVLAGPNMLSPGNPSSVTVTLANSCP